MPKIPVYKSQAELPSVAGRAGTGLQPAPIDLTSAPYQALGQLGESLGRVGASIYDYQERVEKQKDQDRKDNAQAILNDYDNEITTMKDTWANLQTPHEQLDYFDKVVRPYFEKARTRGDNLEELPDSPRFNALKRHGWGDRGVYEIFKGKRDSELNDAYLRFSISNADARNKRDLANSAEIISRAIPKIDGTEEAYNKVIQGATEYFSHDGNGNSDRWNAEQLESGVQTLTKAHLEEAFRTGNIKVINDVLEGKYDEALTDIYKADPAILDTFKDKAKAAKSDFTSQEVVNELEIKYTDIDTGRIDYDKAIQEGVPQKKDLFKDERDKVIAELNKKGTNQKDFINSEAKKEQESFWQAVDKNASPIKLIKMVNDFKYTDSKERVVLKKSILEGDYSSAKRTNPTYALELHNRILLSPGTVTDYDLRAIAGTLSPEDSSKLITFRDKMLKDETKFENDQYKKASKLIQQMIIQGAGFQASFSQDAEGRFQLTTNASPEVLNRSYLALQALEQELKKGETNKISRADMLNPTSDKYIVNKVMLPYLSSYREKKQELIEVQEGLEEKTEERKWWQFGKEETVAPMPTTKLSPNEEDNFQAWYAGWAEITGINPNPDDPLQKYDYRGAFKAGETPKIDLETGEYHWSSKFKLEGHPRMIVKGVNTKTGEPVKPSIKSKTAEEYLKNLQGK